MILDFNFPVRDADVGACDHTILMHSQDFCLIFSYEHDAIYTYRASTKTHVMPYDHDHSLWWPQTRLLSLFAISVADSLSAVLVGTGGHRAKPSGDPGQAVTVRGGCIEGCGTTQVRCGLLVLEVWDNKAKGAALAPVK